MKPMYGRPPSWKSSCLDISSANCPNLTKCGTQKQILTKVTETWPKSEICKFKMADRRHNENHFFWLEPGSILSNWDEIWSEEAESHAFEACQVIKCLITKIQNGRRQHFENRWNRPILTKFCTQMQILTQLKKYDKHKSEISTKKSKYNF